MAQIINLFTNKQAQSDRKIADYFAQQEQDDFLEVFKLLKDQSSYSILFRNIDFDKYCNLILADVKDNFYNSGSELKQSAIREIITEYSERMDLDDLRHELDSEF